jgi:hypothetical protein
MDTIIHPHTRHVYSIYSLEGKNLIKSFVKAYRKKGGARIAKAAAVAAATLGNATRPNPTRVAAGDLSNLKPGAFDNPGLYGVGHPGLYVDGTPGLYVDGTLTGSFSDPPPPIQFVPAVTKGEGKADDLDEETKKEEEKKVNKTAQLDGSTELIQNYVKLASQISFPGLQLPDTWDKFMEPANLESTTNKCIELIGEHTSPDHLYVFLGKLLCPSGTKTAQKGGGGSAAADSGGGGEGEGEGGQVIVCPNPEQTIIKRTTGLLKRPIDYIRDLRYNKLRFKDLQIVNSNSLDRQYVLGYSEIEAMKPFISHRICNNNKSLDMQKVAGIEKRQDFIFASAKKEHSVLQQHGIAGEGTDTSALRVKKERIVSAATSDYDNLAERYLQTKYERFKTLIEKYTGDAYFKRIQTEERPNMKGVADTIVAASSRKKENWLKILLAGGVGLGIFVSPPTIPLLICLIVFLPSAIYSMKKSEGKTVLLKLLMIMLYVFVAYNLKDEIPNEIDAYRGENNFGLIDEYLNTGIVEDADKFNIECDMGELIGSNLQNIYNIVTEAANDMIPDEQPDEVPEETNTDKPSWSEWEWWAEKGRGALDWGWDGASTVFFSVTNWFYQHTIVLFSNLIKKLYLSYGQPILYTIIGLIITHRAYKANEERKIIKHLKKRFTREEIEQLKSCRILLNEIMPPEGRSFDIVIHNIEQETKLIQDTQAADRELARTLMEKQSLDLAREQFEEQKEQHKDKIAATRDQTEAQAAAAREHTAATRDQTEAQAAAAREQTAATREQTEAQAAAAREQTAAAREQTAATRAQVTAAQKRKEDQLFQERLDKLGLNIRRPTLEQQAAREFELLGTLQGVIDDDDPDGIAFSGAIPLAPEKAMPSGTRKTRDVTDMVEGIGKFQRTAIKASL